MGDLEWPPRRRLDDSQDQENDDDYDDYSDDAHGVDSFRSIGAEPPIRRCTRVKRDGVG
jgi:hypothetical protein